MRGHRQFSPAEIRSTPVQRSRRTSASQRFVVAEMLGRLDCNYVSDKMADLESDIDVDFFVDRYPDRNCLANVSTRFVSAD